MATEAPFQPFTPRQLSLDQALCNWMRSDVHRYVGPFYRVTFEQQGGAPAQATTPAVAPTAYRINIFTNLQRVQNGIAFTAPTLTALALAVEIEAPKLLKKRVNT